MHNIMLICTYTLYYTCAYIYVCIILFNVYGYNYQYPNNMTLFEYLTAVAISFRTDMCFQLIEGRKVLSVDEGIPLFPPVSTVAWNDQMEQLYTDYNVQGGPKVCLRFTYTSKVNY